MACVIPRDWQELDDLHELEKETVDWLAEALPDDFHVFAGLRWASVHASGASLFGEVDLVVLGPSGRLLLIEQKNGGLSVENGRIVKRYGQGPGKSVAAQIRRSVDAFKQQWGRQHPGVALQVDYLVYLPDYRIHDLSAVHLDAGHILDRPRARELVAVIEERLAGPGDRAHHDEVRDFLLGRLDLSLDPDIASLRMEQRYRHCTDQLWQAVSRMSFHPWRLRIEGRAGSGKTRLAARVYGRALEQGNRPLYLCFNRPLADRLPEHFPAGGTIMTVDHLTHIYPVAGEFDPAGGAQAFEQRREQILSVTPEPAHQYDLVIVDEGQDFSRSQWRLAEHALAPGGRFLWMEDPAQGLYQRERPPEPSATVTLRLTDNYRCATQITRTINLLLGLDPPDKPASGISGEAPDIRAIDEEQLEQEVADAVRYYLEQGFALDQIAVLSYHGVASSRLCHLERIAHWRTRHFTGEYDEQGRQCYSEGQLRVESLHRFKGLEAPVVILAEVDFETLDDNARRRLYVGMTRAGLRLTVLLSGTAEQALQRAISSSTG